MEKQISIIIPTYNMEAYIGKCLDSLLIPEFDQVEVLVVNDGSRDRSSEIAHSYADRYPNSIRVIDKPNGNYGSCINTALPLTTGRYVKILDADDTFDTDAFSRFVRLLPTLTEDAIITSYVTVDESGNQIKRFDLSEYDINSNQSYSLKSICDKGIQMLAQMHRLTYNTNVFKKFDYHQTEGISYTDNEWAIIPLSYCQSIKFMPICIYHYLLGRSGQTMEDTRILKSLDNFITIGENLAIFAHRINNQVAKDFLNHMTTRLYEFIYFKLFSIWGNKCSQILYETDNSLMKINHDIYLKLNETFLDPAVNFKIFSEIRKTNYSPRFKVPFVVRLKISMAYRFNRFLKFSNK